VTDDIIYSPRSLGQICVAGITCDLTAFEDRIVARVPSDAWAFYLTGPHSQPDPAPNDVTQAGGRLLVES
jgi:hypothetical protein